MICTFTPFTPRCGHGHPSRLMLPFVGAAVLLPGSLELRRLLDDASCLGRWRGSLRGVEATVCPATDQAARASPPRHNGCQRSDSQYFVKQQHQRLHAHTAQTSEPSQRLPTSCQTPETHSQRPLHNSSHPAGLLENQGLQQCAELRFATRCCTRECDAGTGVHSSKSETQYPAEVPCSWVPTSL